MINFVIILKILKTIWFNLTFNNNINYNKRNYY